MSDAQFRQQIAATPLADKNGQTRTNVRSCPEGACQWSDDLGRDAQTRAWDMEARPVTIPWHALANSMRAPPSILEGERTRNEKSRNRISTLVSLYLA
jgi:hypothetical protein